jgi:hypothetical protein
MGKILQQLLEEERHGKLLISMVSHLAPPGLPLSRVNLNLGIKGLIGIKFFPSRAAQKIVHSLVKTARIEHIARYARNFMVDLFPSLSAKYAAYVSKHENKHYPR